MSIPSMTTANSSFTSWRKLISILLLLVLVTSVLADDDDDAGDVSKTGYYTNGGKGEGKGDKGEGKGDKGEGKGDKGKGKGDKGKGKGDKGKGKGDKGKGKGDKGKGKGDGDNGEPLGDGYNTSGKGGTCDITLKGFATVGDGTTGGGKATPKTVKNCEELRQAVKGNTPAVIIVSGTITTGSNSVKIGNNKTLLGAKGAVIIGGLSVITGGKNVIIRNLTVKGNGIGKKPEDCINGRGVKNVWIDHCDLSDAGDGLLDMTKGSDLITVSWTTFWYTSNSRKHRFASLVGAADSNEKLDRGHLRMTYHNNFWSKNILERMARVRFGQVHIVNNYFHSTGNKYCIGAGKEARLLVENNHFDGVKDAIKLHVKGSSEKVSVIEKGNIYTSTKGIKFSGSKNGCEAFTKPPYSFTAMSAKDVKAKVTACSGPVITSQLNIK